MPPLQKQNAEIPLRGLDTHADPKNAPLGSFDLVENLYFKRGGGGKAELRKRYGVTALTRDISGGGTISTGKKLATLDDQRLLLSDQQVYSYAPQVTDWFARGAWFPAGVTAEKVSGDVYVRSSPASAVSGNLMCSVNNSASDGPHVTVVDLNTGTRLINDVAMGANPGPVHVVALETKFAIFHLVAGGGTINACTVTYATPTSVSSLTPIVTDVDTTSNTWDVVQLIQDGPNYFGLLAYHSTASGGRLRLRLVNNGLGASSPVDVVTVPNQAIGWLNWDASDDYMYVAHVGSTGGAKLTEIDVQTIGSLVLGTTTTMDAAVTSARNATGFHTAAGGPAGSNTVFIEVAGSPASNTLIRRWKDSGSSAVWQRALGLWSRVWKQGSRYYFAAAYESVAPASGTGQNCYFLLDATDTAPAVFAKVLYGLGGGLTTYRSTLADPAAISASVWAVPVVRYSHGNAAGTYIFDAYYMRVDYSASLSACKRLGEALHIPGSSVRLFDGSAATELGHHLYPEISSLAQAAGGSLTATAVYSIAACYAWVDAKGQIHRGPMSPTQSITLTGGNQTISWTTSYARVGNKPSFAATGVNMHVELYMSLGNGSTLYLLARLLNDPAQDSFNVTGQAVDPAVTNGTAYTTGGVLPRIPPPPARLMEVWRGRLFLAGTEYPDELWVGNEQVTGDGASFSDALAFRVEGGPITALAEQDDRLIIFHEAAIYALSGAGPTARGAGQFEQPTKLCSGIGASGPGGIVKSKDGVIFKSNKGWYILPVGGGLPVRLFDVEAYDGNTPSAGLVVRGEEQVRLYTAEGRTMVYHWGFQKETGLGAFTTFTGQAAVDAAIWNGKVAYLASDGTVQEEITGQYADNGSNITAKVRFAWMHLAGLLGRFRCYGVRLLGEIMASFTLSSTLAATDFTTTTVQTATLAVTTSTKQPLGISPKYEKAPAYQVTVEETSQTEGFRLSAVALEVGIKPGGVKLPTVQGLSP